MVFIELSSFDEQWGAVWTLLLAELLAMGVLVFGIRRWNRRCPHCGSSTTLDAHGSHERAGGVSSQGRTVIGAVELSMIAGGAAVCVVDDGGQRVDGFDRAVRD